MLNRPAFSPCCAHFTRPALEPSYAVVQVGTATIPLGIGPWHDEMKPYVLLDAAGGSAGRVRMGVSVWKRRASSTTLLAPPR